MSYHQPDDPEPYTMERDLEFTQSREVNLIKKLNLNKKYVSDTYEWVVKNRANISTQGFIGIIKNIENYLK